MPTPSGHRDRFSEVTNGHTDRFRGQIQSAARFYRSDLEVAEVTDTESGDPDWGSDGTSPAVGCRACGAFPKNRSALQYLRMDLAVPLTKCTALRELQVRESQRPRVTANGFLG